MGQDPVTPQASDPNNKKSSTIPTNATTAANRISPIKDMKEQKQQNGTTSSEKPESSDQDKQELQETSDEGTMNGNKENKKMTKTKNWVPLPIDLPKPDRRRERRSPPRRSSRRHDDYEDDYYSERPPRNSRYRPGPVRGSWRSGDRPVDKPRAPPTRSSNRPSSRGGGGRRSNPRSDRTRSGNTINRHGEYNNQSDYIQSHSGTKTPNSLNGGEQSSYMMPYLGTYYYNGTPLYNVVPTNIKDCIKKQM